MLSISVLFYRNKTEDVKAVLVSLARATACLHHDFGVKTQCFFIDNSVSESYTHILQREVTSRLSDKDYLDYKLIVNLSNIGFGCAHNLVMRKAICQFDYHLVLNPDVILNEDVLTVLYKYMKQHHDVGLITPKILGFDGATQKTCKLLPMPLNLFIRRFPVSKSLLARLNRDFELHNADYNKVMEIPFLSGCFMFVRTAALQEVGLFDERFFMYLEDVDLCRRIGQKYRTVYYPLVSISHAHAAGSYKRLRLLYFHISSAVKYFNKWGWIRDKQREIINRKTKQQFNNL